MPLAYVLTCAISRRDLHTVQPQELQVLGSSRLLHQWLFWGLQSITKRLGQTLLSRSDTYLFCCDVKPSWRVTEKPHQTWVAVQGDGTILTVSYQILSLCRGDYKTLGPDFLRLFDVQKSTQQLLSMAANALFSPTA